MKTTSRSTTNQGFTLVEITICVAILAVLAFAAVGLFYKAQANAAQRYCKDNLVMTMAAKWQWAESVSVKSGVNLFDSKHIGYWRTNVPTMGTLGLSFECPSGGKYTVGQVVGGGYPTCTHPGHTLEDILKRKK